MNSKIAIESLVMDLKRVAVGYHRGSITMAKRFSEEALKRKNEINDNDIKPYIKHFLTKLDETLHNTDTDKIAEDSLMLSTILQNYIQSSFI
jgi:hypothetical protein